MKNNVFLYIIVSIVLAFIAALVADYFVDAPAMEKVFFFLLGTIGGLSSSQIWLEAERKRLEKEIRDEK